MTSPKGTGFELPLFRGPFQNNGATPWYCELAIGTPAQPLKICFDTGSNFNWVTSSLCAEDSCNHYSDSRFNISASLSFEWISTKEKSVSFGPWGTMKVETGRDELSLSQTSYSEKLFIDLFLAKEYSGTQFEELDWDGGIGLPSSQTSSMSSFEYPSSFRLHHAKNSDESHFHFFLRLVQKGLVSEKAPYITFLTESNGTKEETGTIGFGQLDKSYATSLDYVYLPWSCYQKEASYLWSTAGATISVDKQVIGSDMFFALDSGSSQFKGDESVLSQVFNLTKTQDQNPVVTIVLSDASGLEYGKFELTSDIYKYKIEAGKKEGQIVSQFQGLSGADNMLLVGSVLMDHLYTVYEYEMISKDELRPKGVWAFNKLGGPKIIKTKQTSPAVLFDNDKKATL